MTEEVARRNFTTGGLWEDEVRLVRGYSTDEQVRCEVAEQSYGVVVVDGDHPATGVYQDCGGSRTWWRRAGSW